jgi:hypothetical protein
MRRRRTTQASFVMIAYLDMFYFSCLRVGVHVGVYTAAKVLLPISQVAVVWYQGNGKRKKIHVKRRPYGEQPLTDDQRVIDFVELCIEPPLLHPTYVPESTQRFAQHLLVQAVVPLTR